MIHRCVLLLAGVGLEVEQLPGLLPACVYDLPAGKLDIALVPTPVSNPKDVSPEAPKATIEASATDVYLVITSEPANLIAPVKIQVVDATQESDTKGRMIWFNLTSNTVKGKVGTQELSLGPNVELVLPLPAEKAGEYPVDLMFQIPDKDADYPLCETKWSHDGLDSNLFVIVVKSDSRTPRIMAFPDHR